jgi:hypothetical protein
MTTTGAKRTASGVSRLAWVNDSRGNIVAREESELEGAISGFSASQVFVFAGNLRPMPWFLAIDATRRPLIRCLPDDYRERLHAASQASGQRPAGSAALTPRSDRGPGTCLGENGPRHDWQFLENKLDAVYIDGPGQPPLPTRLMAGLAILKHMHNLSDEALCERWLSAC